MTLLQFILIQTGSQIFTYTNALVLNAMGAAIFALIILIVLDQLKNLLLILAPILHIHTLMVSVM